MFLNNINDMGSNLSMKHEQFLKNEDLIPCKQLLEQLQIISKTIDTFAI